MPLVRRDPSAPPKGESITPSVRSAEELGAALESMRDLRGREALLAALLALADASAAAARARHLRSEDAGLRHARLQKLQARPPAAHPVRTGLLADPDPDVRLLATEVARAQPNEVASGLLARLLEGETHPNVCGAAVEVLAEVGMADALPALRAVRARFASEPFLPMAVDTVVARIGAGR